MNFRIVLDGSKKTVSITPENDSDRKLLEFLAEHKSALLSIEHVKQGQYDHSNPQISLVKFTLDNPKTNTQ